MQCASCEQLQAEKAASCECTLAGMEVSGGTLLHPGLRISTDKVPLSMSSGPQRQCTSIWIRNHNTSYNSHHKRGSAGELDYRIGSTDTVDTRNTRHRTGNHGMLQAIKELIKIMNNKRLQNLEWFWRNKKSKIQQSRFKTLMNKGRAESSMSEAAHKPESVLRVSSGAQQTDSVEDRLWGRRME